MNKKALGLLLALGLCPQSWAQQWPIAGTGPSSLESTFGPRLGRSFHGGLDFPVPGGTDVVATRAGIVTAVGQSGTLGNFIVISNRDVFGHLSSQAFTQADVTAQTAVAAGDLVGLSGNSGPANTPFHLHLQDGGQIVGTPPIHPLRYLPYTPAVPTLRAFDIERTVLKQGTFMSSGTIRIEALTEAITRDLDLVVLDVPPTLPGFPMRFDYASPALHDGVDSPSDPIRLLGGDWFGQTQTAGQPTVVEFFYTYDTRRAGDGLYTVQACLTNTKATTSCSPFNWVIDNHPPTVTVRDAQGDIQPNGFSSGQGISVVADDRNGSAVTSGLSRIEVWKGDPLAGGQLLASNDDDHAEQHTYTASDSGLSVLANLPEGQILVKVVDQVGNDTSVNISAVSV